MSRWRNKLVQLLKNTNYETTAFIFAILFLQSQEHLHNKYNRYAAMFYTCETSNLLIVASQILVINKFLNYQFLSYGLNVCETYILNLSQPLVQALKPV